MGRCRLACGQTISQPYIVAVMTDLLELTRSETVLEIGTGSGYQAAVLAQMARQVHTVERYAALARQAEADLALNWSSRTSTCTWGMGRWAGRRARLTQAILVTAAAPSVPQALLDQLAEGGRLVLPVGGSDGQDLQRWQRAGRAVSRRNPFPGLVCAAARCGGLE